MPLKNKKIVISGGPGSGKTTLIDLLNKNGFDCIEELSEA
jgi:predicted ATPase